LVAQAVGSLLQRKAPIVQHEEIVGGADRAGNVVEVGVLIGMQADHLAERQQQAEGEHRERCRLPDAAAAAAEPTHQFCEGNARQHRHRWNHKDEMTDAVIERGALHHRDDQRQHCRHRQHEEDSLAARRDVLARQRHQGPADGRGEQAEQHFGQLQRKQRRQIGPWH
ncbi:hypothetical protein KXW38_001807, partial [Aspergillus fumigatus]